MSTEPLPPVECYPGKINQVVMNLLLNAIDACQGKGTITVTANRTTLDDEDAVRIRIADSGPGIDAERLKHIWEPYVTHKAGGTGLGLTIARQAVWAHNGTVAASSVVGEGTQIEFMLPVATETVVIGTHSEHRAHRSSEHHSERGVDRSATPIVPPSSRHTS